MRLRQRGRTCAPARLVLVKRYMRDIALILRIRATPSMNRNEHREIIFLVSTWYIYIFFPLLLTTFEISSSLRVNGVSIDHLTSMNFFSINVFLSNRLDFSRHVKKIYSEIIDSLLFSKLLMFRWNFQVPSNFRFVVEQTLKEFFKAIQGGKDTEQSWKKSIYKVISRLDDPVPEYFKTPNFLQQLG